MYRQQFEQMSIDQLWDLHKEVESLLGKMLIVKKNQLETRLEQLRHQADKDNPSQK